MKSQKTRERLIRFVIRIQSFLFTLNETLRRFKRFARLNWGKSLLLSVMRIKSKSQQKQYETEKGFFF